MADLHVPDDQLKSLRETLCIAQHAILSGDGGSRKARDAAHIGTLINRIDAHRPVGTNGKHGNRHTATCGCSDVAGRGEYNEATGLYDWYEEIPPQATIAARLVLDTTDFDAAVARVQESLEALASTPIRVRIES